jgi:DNA replication protein DnaC
VITQASEQFDWGFETFNERELNDALKAVKRFGSAIQLNEDPHWLTLLGISGTGKTHLAMKIVKFWRERGGFRVVKGAAGDFKSLGDSRFTSWPKFIDRQRSGVYSEMEDLQEMPLLALDEIAADRDPNDFGKARLYDLLNARLNKWTVITSNLPNIEAVAHSIDQRIASRLMRCGSVVIRLNDTKDFNLRKPNK